MVQKRKDNSNTVVRLPNDPSYQNRSLGEWLRVRDSSGGLSTNAVEALRRMGTNVVPALLARVAYKDPVFHLYDSDVSMEAVIALIALREEAKPALPGLAALMDSKDQDLAMRAMLASIGTGVEAVPCLMKGLTNRFPEVRAEAVNTLTSEWSAPFRDQCQQAIPFLVILLSDPDPSVRLNAAKGLKEIDPQAAAKAGVR